MTAELTTTSSSKTSQNMSKKEDKKEKKKRRKRENKAAKEEEVAMSNVDDKAENLDDDVDEMGEKKQKHHDKADVKEDAADDEAQKVVANKDDDKKKKKKRKRHDDDDDDDDEEESSNNPTDDNKDKTLSEKDKKAALRREKKKQRRAEKERLEQLVPKVDEHGIAYTKLQLRRMRKRVARGLDPVETPAETQERLARDAEMRREEQAELADMLFDPNNNNTTKKQHNSASTGEDDAEVEEEEEDDGDEEDRVEGDDNHPNEEEETEPALKTTPPPAQQHAKKNKPRRKKPVPADYVCSACQNQGGHWIYDCPNKITMPGTNLKAKKHRGVHLPDERKVFVSGLPFDAKTAHVKQLFGACGPTVHIKMLKFADTGRCKGQAYVTFETIEGTKKALKLSGTTIENNNSSTDKAPATTSPGKRKELKLKVTKVLSRFVTKAKKK